MLQAARFSNMQCTAYECVPNKPGENLRWNARITVDIPRKFEWGSEIPQEYTSQNPACTSVGQACQEYTRGQTSTSHWIGYMKEDGKIYVGKLFFGYDVATDCRHKFLGERTCFEANKLYQLNCWY